MSALVEVIGTVPAVEVLVLEDRARVLRRGRVKVIAGQTRVTIAGVAPVMSDKSLAARAEGATVLDVRCERRLAPWASGAELAGRGAEAAALRAAQREATRELARVEADRVVADREAAALGQVVQLALAELADDSAWGRAPGTASAETLGKLDGRERSAVERAATLAADVARRRRELDALGARVNTASTDAGIEAASVIVDLVADAPAEVELEVDYLVPGACWRPYHTATLLEGDQVELVTDACVWQSTGEDWREVALSFSTERPSLGAEPPDLVDDELRVQRKSDVVVVEARDQEINDTGLGVDRQVAAAAEVPGVDDGGVAVTLRSEHAATIPGDGRPWRVGLGRFQSDAEVDLVAYPEKAPVAFLRSKQANSGGRPLLAGPVDLVRDHGLVGRTSILFVAAGERFTLGWGPDADLRVHREQHRIRDEAGMLGSWNETKVRVEVRISNLGDRARRLKVIERAPISEIEKVQITVSPATGWKPGDGTDGDKKASRERVPVITERTIDEDGLVTWDVELPALGRRAVGLEYVVKAHTSVVGV